MLTVLLFHFSFTAILWMPYCNLGRVSVIQSIFLFIVSFQINRLHYSIKKKYGCGEDRKQSLLWVWTEICVCVCLFISA